MKSLILTLALIFTVNANAAEFADRELSMETAEDLAEQVGYDEATMTFDPDIQEERESNVAQGVDCSGDNNEIRIEDYDVVTRTFEIIDTMCEGQGPFYSTAEAIGESVSVLWMKTDPKFFLDQTFRTSKPLEFHPTREEAMEERESLKGASLNKRNLRKRQPFLSGKLRLPRLTPGKSR